MIVKAQGSGWTDHTFIRIHKMPWENQPGTLLHLHCMLTSKFSCTCYRRGGKSPQKQQQGSHDPLRTDIDISAIVCLYLTFGTALKEYGM